MRFFIRKKSAPRYETAELLFCPEVWGRQTIERISDLIKLPAEKEENTVRFRQQGVEFSFAAFGTEDEGEAQVYARQELSSVRGYLYSLDTEYGDVKRHLMYTLERCGCVVRVHYSFSQKGGRADREKILLAENMINEAVRGIQGIRTKGGGALAGPDGRIILDENGNSKVKFYLPPLDEKQEWKETDGKACSKEALERRRKNIAKLRRSQIYTPSSLPVTELSRESQRRTKHQICGRAAALLAVSLYSECLLGEGMAPSEAGTFIRDIVRRFGAEKFFSPSEKAYLKDRCPDEITQIRFSWQYENLYVMEWALGLFERLKWPETICDIEECVTKIKKFQSLEEMEKQTRLRPERELLDAADLYYRLHWACRDAEINGYPAPGKILSEAAAERRRGLFWVSRCRESEGETPAGDEWDQTDLITWGKN